MEGKDCSKVTGTPGSGASFSSRGVRISWCRYDSLFKRLAIGPKQDKILEVFAPNIRKSLFEEALEIEKIIGSNVLIPDNDYFENPDVDLSNINEAFTSAVKYLNNSKNDKFSSNSFIPQTTVDNNCSNQIETNVHVKNDLKVSPSSPCCLASSVLKSLASTLFDEQAGSNLIDNTDTKSRSKTNQVDATIRPVTRGASMKSEVKSNKKNRTKDNRQRTMESTSLEKNVIGKGDEMLGNISDSKGCNAGDKISPISGISDTAVHIMHVKESLEDGDKKLPLPAILDFGHSVIWSAFDIDTDEIEQLKKTTKNSDVKLNEVNDDVCNDEDYVVGCLLNLFEERKKRKLDDKNDFDEFLDIPLHDAEMKTLLCKSTKILEYRELTYFQLQYLQKFNDALEFCRNSNYINSIKNGCCLGIATKEEGCEKNNEVKNSLNMIGFDKQHNLLDKFSDIQKQGIPKKINLSMNYNCKEGIKDNCKYELEKKSNYDDIKHGGERINRRYPVALFAEYEKSCAFVPTELGGIKWENGWQGSVFQKSTKELLKSVRNSRHSCFSLVKSDSDFVGFQCAQLLLILQAIASDLDPIKLELYESVLHENEFPIRLCEIPQKVDAYHQKYYASNRWNVLKQYIISGHVDVVVEENKSSVVFFLEKKSVSNDQIASDDNTSSCALATDDPSAMLPAHLSTGKCCAVCFGAEASNLNPIFTCHRCHVDVHTACYSAVRNVDGSPYLVDNHDSASSKEWFCQRCEADKKIYGSQWQSVFVPCSAKCSICLKGGGALKKVKESSGQWVHVTCAVWLLPETACDNFDLLEPWALAAVASWRQNVTCSICDQSGGYCVRCGCYPQNDDLPEERNAPFNTPCNTFFHPLCAWLFGLYVQVTEQKLQFLKHLGQFHQCFTGIAIRTFCIIHTPAHCKNRSSGIQRDIRASRYINRDIRPEWFSNTSNIKEKKKVNDSTLSRRNIRTPQLQPAGMSNDTRSTYIIQQPDRYLDSFCAVCLEAGDTTDKSNILLSCSGCALCVHRYCYGFENSIGYLELDTVLDGFKDDLNNTYSVRFRCEVCRIGLKPEEVACCLCPRKGGALKSAEPGEPSALFAHVVCCMWCPGIEIGDNDLMQPVLGLKEASEFYNTLYQQQLLSLEENPQQTCDVCSVPYGFLLECSQKGCVTKFHPLCGQLKSYSLEICDDKQLGYTSIAFCGTHSTSQAAVTPIIRLYLKLRVYLELTKILVDHVKRRDTSKKEWLEKKIEKLKSQFPGLIEALARSGYDNCKALLTSDGWIKPGAISKAVENAEFGFEQSKNASLSRSILDLEYDSVPYHCGEEPRLKRKKERISSDSKRCVVDGTNIISNHPENNNNDNNNNHELHDKSADSFGSKTVKKSKTFRKKRRNQE